MHVTVTKHPDGVHYMTKDGHGPVLEEDLGVNDETWAAGDCTIQIVTDPHPFAEEDALLVRFSWVDYMDTSTPGAPHETGIRHTNEAPAPGRNDFGPYTVETTDVG